MADSSRSVSPYKSHPAPESPSPSLPDEGYDEQRIEIPKWVQGWSDEQRAELAIQLLKSVPPSVFSRSYARLTPLFQFRDFLVLLPYELTVHLLSFLDASTLSKVALVSKAWNRFACDNTVWKRIYFQRGWTVNQAMVDWYLRPSIEREESWLQEQQYHHQHHQKLQKQEQERYRACVRFETAIETVTEMSAVKSGKRKMVECDMMDVDGGGHSRDGYSPRRAPSTTAQDGSEDEREHAFFGSQEDTEYPSSPSFDQDVTMAQFSDDANLSSSHGPSPRGICTPNTRYMSVSPDGSPSMLMESRLGSSPPCGDAPSIRSPTSSPSQRHGRFSLSGSTFMPSLHRNRGVHMPMYISNHLMTPPSMLRKMSQRATPPVPLRLPNLFSGGGITSPSSSPSVGSSSAGPTRFFGHRRTNSLDPSKSDSQPTSPNMPSSPTLPNSGSGSNNNNPATGSLSPASSKSLWNVIRHGVMGVSGSSAWPSLHSHRSMDGREPDTSASGPGFLGSSSSSSSPSTSHHHFFHQHHHHSPSLPGWLMHLPSTLNSSRHQRSSTSPPMSPMLGAFLPPTSLDGAAAAAAASSSSFSRKIPPKMPARTEFSSDCAPRPEDLLPASTLAIHRDSVIGRPMINWKYLCKQRTLLEKNWNHGTHSARELPGHTEGIYCVQFDDHKIISGSRDNTIKVWDLSSGECARTFIGHTASVLCLQYDDNRIVSGSSDTNILVWDIETGLVTKTLDGHSDSVLSLRFEGDTVVSCSKDRTVRIWKISTGEMVRTLVGHRAAVNAVQFSPESPASASSSSSSSSPPAQGNPRIVVSASGDKTIKVWSFETGECLRTLEGHARGIACIQFEGNCIISGSSDRTIKIWDISRGECVQTLTGHEGLVRTLQFSGRKIISGSYDESIKIWDRATGKMLADLEGRHSHRVFKLQFNESKIVSCSQDQKIIIWDFGADVDMTFIT